jgi:hypothetical protein
MSLTQLLLLPYKMQQTCRSAACEKPRRLRSLSGADCWTMLQAAAFQRFKISNKIGFHRVLCPKFGRDDAAIDQEIAW